MISHLIFDFFGTLVRYSASRTAQGYPGSHALLRDAGCALDYAAFLALWDETASGFERDAERTLREFSMEDVCGAFLERALDRLPARDQLVEVRPKPFPIESSTAPGAVISQS